MDAKAGECQVRRQLARVDAAAGELEHLRPVADLASRAVDDLVQLDRLLEAAAAVKELQAECTFGLRPQRVIVSKADRLVLLVRQPA